MSQSPGLICPGFLSLTEIQPNFYMPKKNAELKEEVVTPEVIHDSPQEPQTPAEAMIAPLTVFDKKLSEFEAHKSLTISGLGDKEGYKKVDEARKEIKRTRIESEKVADGILEPLTNLVNQVRDKKKHYIKEFKAIEDTLQSQTDDYDRKEQEEKDRIAAEAEARYNKRMDQLFTLGAKFNGHTSYKVGEIAVTSQEIKTLSDEKFIEITGLMEVEAELIREQERKEEERLAEEKRLREEEAEHQRQEAEKLRQEKEQLEKEKAEMQAQLQKEKEELEAQLKAVREEAAAAERERIRKEREVEQERLRKEEEEAAEREEGVYQSRLMDIARASDQIIEYDGVLAYRNSVLVSTNNLRKMDVGDYVDFLKKLPEVISNIDKEAEEESKKKQEAYAAEVEAATQAMLKAEQDRLAAEKAAAEREEILKPDKQKLTDASGRIKDFPTKLAFASPEAKAIHEQLTVKMEEVAAWLNQSVETL